MTDNAKPCILYDNRFNDTTIVSNSTASGYDANNIGDLRPFTWWKEAAKTNLEANGASWTGASGATPPTGWDVLTAGTFGISGGYLTITKNALDDPAIYNEYAVTIGKKYRVSCILRKTGALAAVPTMIVHIPAGAVYGTETQAAAGAGVHTVIFTATDTTLRVTLVQDTATAEAGWFDSLTVYEVATIAAANPLGGTADTLAIVGHNLFTALAVVSVESSTDEVTWTERLAGFTPTSDKALLVKFTASATAVHWRVVIATSSVAAQIAVCLLGTRMDFERFPSGNFDPAPEKLNGVAARSKMGHMVGATLQNIGIEIRADFKSLTPAWIEATFRPAWDDHLSLLKPFFFAWDTANHPADVYFVSIPEGFDLRMPFDPFRRSLSLIMEGIKET
jgi:hypothetical protein